MERRDEQCSETGKSDKKRDWDFGDVVVWGFISAVASAFIGGITGITFLQLIPVVLIAPFILVVVVAFLGQVYFTGKDIKKDFKKTFGGGRTFGKRPNRRR